MCVAHPGPPCIASTSAAILFYAVNWPSKIPKSASYRFHLQFLRSQREQRYNSSTSSVALTHEYASDLPNLGDSTPSTQPQIAVPFCVVLLLFIITVVDQI